jgi:RNA polymerase sigma-70 factor (ECF subfamily)
VNTTKDIWYKYHMRLTAFIRSKVTEDAVEDILQDVFLKIFSRIDSLKEDTKLESWVYQITRNTIIDHYRTRKIGENFSDWIEQPQVEESETIRKELSSCFEPIIRKLPEKYRQAVQMSEIDNSTQREVAEQEGISISGAKSRIQRGRALLKGMLYECCQFEINKRNHVISYEQKEQDCKFC